jgi:hypothetical protein
MCRRAILSSLTKPQNRKGVEQFNRDQATMNANGSYWPAACRQYVQSGTGAAGSKTNSLVRPRLSHRLLQSPVVGSLMRQLQLPQVTLQRQLRPPSPQAACHTCLGVLPAHLDWLHAACFMFFLSESLPPALQNCLRHSLPALKCPIHQRLFSSSWPLARFLNPGFSAIIYLWCLTLAPHAVKVRRNVKTARSSFTILNSRSFALVFARNWLWSLSAKTRNMSEGMFALSPKFLFSDQGGGGLVEILP